MTIETGCTSSIFYASHVKALKSQFGNTLLLADLRLKSMLDKQQMKPLTTGPRYENFITKWS